MSTRARARKLMIQRLSFVIAAGMAFTILFAGIAGSQETQTSPLQKEIDLLRSRVEDYRNSGDYQNLKKTMLELAATYHDSGNPEQEMMVDYSLSQEVWLEGDFQLAVDVLEKAFRIARETNEAGAQPYCARRSGS